VGEGKRIPRLRNCELQLCKHEAGKRKRGTKVVFQEGCKRGKLFVRPVTARHRKRKRKRKTARPNLGKKKESATPGGMVGKKKKKNNPGSRRGERREKEGPVFALNGFGKGKKKKRNKRRPF